MIKDEAIWKGKGRARGVDLTVMNLDNAVKGAILANFSNQGQVCSNGTRVFVEESIAEEFLAKLIERVENMQIGDPYHEDTTIGATISPQQAGIVEDYIGIAKKELLANVSPQKKGSSARWIALGDPGVHASSSIYRIKPVTWNVQTLQEPGALSCVVQEMEHMHIDLLGILETHWPDAGDFRAQSLKSEANYRVIYSGGEQHRHGVALIFNDKMS
ncbi:NAD/NADP-dependent betaine aldehyde dehydrogenase [Elysia marginata]|uniref:NAD/NADP-dependent betaine aldehyde dehydrogenase n=1 Tax=Elysia marginata TaxID=1093978 RepID=A0AAV4EEM1_9GAST|nr:NAD/NADP-dependent betaine aldehyde dehydrogenase [Elysia marginata]